MTIHVVSELNSWSTKDENTSILAASGVLRLIAVVCKDASAQSKEKDSVLSMSRKDS